MRVCRLVNQRLIHAPMRMPMTGMETMKAMKRSYCCQFKTVWSSRPTSVNFTRSV